MSKNMIIAERGHQIEIQEARKVHQKWVQNHIKNYLKKGNNNDLRIVSKVDYSWEGSSKLKNHEKRYLRERTESDIKN